MKINLKTTIIASSLVAATLNLGQFLSSTQQKQAAIDGVAYAKDAAPTTPGPTVNKLAAASTATPPPVSPTTSQPATTATESAVAARLSAAGLNPQWAGLYLSVSQKTGTPWQLLAAVHRIETGQSGTTTRTSYAGATGPMQFMPATFRAYASDGNGDGTTDIHNIDDAMLSAGRYLAANGANHGQYQGALYHYNHSWTYVANVTAIARKLGL
jgi:membrane-bound lytic murein transglycosylase B